MVLLKSLNHYRTLEHWQLLYSLAIRWVESEQKHLLCMTLTDIQGLFWNTIQFLCRCKSAVTTDISTSANEAYGKVIGGVIGGGGIPTSTNEAYGKVVGGEGEEGYEMVKISHREPPPPPAKLEEIYEVPLSPAPPSQSLPTISPTHCWS